MAAMHTHNAHHDAHVWAWMDEGIQDLIDEPVTLHPYGITLLPPSPPKPRTDWAELVDQFLKLDPAFDLVAQYRDHHLCKPFELPPQDIPF